MKTVPATEAKNRLGAILDDAQREPIVIRRQDRDIAVVLSMADYERLRSGNIQAFLDLRDQVAAEAAANGLTMTGERVVIDTNVLISSLFLATSTPAQAVDKAVTKAQLVATMETLRELIEKLHSPKFDRYVRRERRDALLERVASLVEIIDVLQSIRASRDPKDDKFLEAAVNGRADAIVTGDKDLLDLNPFRGIAIVTPAAYLVREK